MKIFRTICLTIDPVMVELVCKMSKNQFRMWIYQWQESILRHLQESFSRICCKIFKDHILVHNVLKDLGIRELKSYKINNLFIKFSSCIIFKQWLIVFVVTKLEHWHQVYITLSTSVFDSKYKCLLILACPKWNFNI